MWTILVPRSLSMGLGQVFLGLSHDQGTRGRPPLSGREFQLPSKIKGV